MGGRFADGNRRLAAGGIMSKHTPGPWKSFPTAREDFSRVITSADCLVQVAYTREVYGERMTYGPTVETTANARLITAAPELLAALQQLRSWQAGKTRLTPEDKALIAVANLAIAKATRDKS